MIKSSSFAKLFSEKLGKLLAFVPLNPDSITVLSVVLAAMAYFTWNATFVSQVQAFILFALAFFFDAIDGAIARAKKLASKKGAFLDGISDRVVEFFLVLAILKYAPDELRLPFISILFFGTAMTSFVKAYAEHSEVLSHDEAMKMPGMLERAERSALLLLIALLLIFKSEPLLGILVYFTAALSVLTFFQRFFMAYSKDS